LTQTHENHVYTVEPQAINYTTHGDLWDHVHDRHLARGEESVLLPLTLEISAQRWYRKNPGQLLTRVGLFHPVKAHRIVRAQRRHKLLFDFLLRATRSHRSWAPDEPSHRATLLREALERWFGE
jgi:hypothetical protein